MAMNSTFKLSNAKMTYVQLMSIPKERMMSVLCVMQFAILARKIVINAKNVGCLPSLLMRLTKKDFVHVLKDF